MDSSMIRVSTPLKRRLAHLKSHERESFGDVIGRLVMMAENEPPLSEGEISQIQDSLEDVKAGRVHSFSDGIKKWRH